MKKYIIHLQTIQSHIDVYIRNQYGEERCEKKGNEKKKEMNK